MTVISPGYIADLLGKSPSWVYQHAADLGASKIGGSYIFTQEGLNDAIEAGKTVARENQGRRKDVHAGRVQHETGGRGLGKRQTAGATVRDRARGLGLVVVER